MTELCLDLRDVTAGYSPEIAILNSLSLSVPHGTLAGIVGLNGAGKSTVMKVVMGFLKPTSGSVHILGQDVTGADTSSMIDRGVWLIPQESSLFASMSVEDNLRLPLERLRRAGGKPTKAEIETRLADVYRIFPVLADKRKSAAASLSGGQQKTVEFAKAYVIQPKLCLIDEPSIGLSPGIAEDIYAFIEMFRKGGTTMLLIDHNIKRVIDMSDKTYVLTLGRVSAEGVAADFSPGLHDHVKQWLGVSI